MDDAAVVDGESRLEVGLTAVGELFERAADAGVVDQNVYRSEFGGSLS